MKIGLISDIHGNAVALKAVLNDLRQKQVDKIVVLGDICFRGPQPKESIDIVRSLHTDVIKGNADAWVVRGINTGEVPDQAFEIMTKERDWVYSLLDQDDINYLNHLPHHFSMTADDIKIAAFHATPDDLFEIIQPHESDQVFREKMMDNKSDIHLYGHIHKAFIRYIKGQSVVNLGSVGLPFDGIQKASYALLETNADQCQTSIVKVDYDVDKVIRQFNESDYPNKDFMINVLKNAKI